MVFIPSYLLLGLALISGGLAGGIIRNPERALRRLGNQANSTSYCDDETNVCYQMWRSVEHDTSFALALPPVKDNSDEFIGLIIAPTYMGYTGLSLGAMVKSLQIIVWPYDGELLYSNRWTSACNPQIYPGPKLTKLKDSRLNATHVRFSFRCQNCTEWDGGFLPLGNFTNLAWAGAPNLPVEDPSDPASPLSYHDITGFFGFDLPKAHTKKYKKYLKSLLPPTDSTQIVMD